MGENRKSTKPNNLLRSERKNRGWSQSRVAELIDADPTMVSRWERGHRSPEPAYQEKLCNLFKKNAAELGFIEQEEIPLLTSSTQSSRQNFSTDSFSSANVLDTILNDHKNRPVIIVLGQNNPSIAPSLQSFSTVEQVDKQRHHLASLSEIASSHSFLSEEDTMKRRDFTQKVVVTAGAMFAPPSNSLLSELSELSERFSRAVQKSSTIDDNLLCYLERQTEHYWQDRQSATVASLDLFSYVKGHFQKILALLEEPLVSTKRRRLCSIAAWTALLVGELLIDIGYYTQARKFEQDALTAAQEAHNDSLEAVAWGRTSLAWIYSKNASEAFSCIQQGRQLAREGGTPTICAWLAAIEAEIQADLFQPNACLKALDDAEQFEDRHHSPKENYLIHFDRALLGGYQGICFRKLYRPEDSRSIAFLGKAQEVLLDALGSLDPALIQRQPKLLTDLADTYIQQAEIEEACKRASQAMTIAVPMKLQKILQRLLSLRQDLERWKDTQYVKNLDRHLVPLFASQKG